MRSVGAAGWSQHGYFGLTAKTFGNPTGASSGDGGVPPPVSAAENAAAFALGAGNGGLLLLGFLGATSAAVFTASRFNAVFDALAAQADTPAPSLDNGLGPPAAFTDGIFVTADGDGTIANTADNGATWQAAINPGGAVINGPYGVTFDGVNNRVMLSDTNSTNIFVSVNSAPLNLSSSATGAANPVGPVAYKGFGGITLALEQGGGAGPQVWKSTDGGAIWTAVSPSPFVGNAGFFVGFGNTRWLSVGAEAGTGNLQTSVSTDDGTTWSAAATLPGSSASGSNPVSVATDNAGNWVIINNAGGGVGPANYWISNDDGVSFAAPGLFAAQGGAPAGGLVFSGGQWCAVWFDPTQSFNFLATSADGRAWAAGPNITEPA